MTRWASILLAAAAAGCLHDDRTPRDRAAPDFGQGALTVKAPPNRCASHIKTALRGSCEEARYLSQLYVRRLSTSDQVCLEGGFGEPPAASCMCRASVGDVGTDKVLLEIRDARPESRWFKSVGAELWFEEGALVDLYLAEHGY